MEIAALILGICSVLFCAVPGLGFVMGVVAVILGLKARGRANEQGASSGLAVGGAVAGGFGALFGLLCTVGFVLLIVGGFYSFSTYRDQVQQDQEQALQEMELAAERERAEMEAMRQLQEARMRAEQEREAARAEAAAAEAEALRAAQERARNAAEGDDPPRRRKRGAGAIGDDPLGGLEL